MTEMCSQDDFTIVKNPGKENMEIITKEGQKINRYTPCLLYTSNIALNGRFLSKVNTEEDTSNTSYEETEKVTYPAVSYTHLIPIFANMR